MCAFSSRDFQKITDFKHIDVFKKTKKSMCWSHKTLVLHEKHPGHDLFNAACLRFCRSFSFSLFHIKMSMFDTQANEVNVLVLLAGDFAV